MKNHIWSGSGVTMRDDVVLMDGAVGTSLWEKFDNDKDKVPVWRYNIEHPEVVRQVEQEFIDAGSQIVLANTFGANRGNMVKTDYTVDQIVGAAMEIAHDTIEGHALIGLAVGPLTGLLEPYGEIPVDEAYDMFNEQITRGVAGKPDVIYIQTFMSLQMMQLAAKAARQFDIPLICSFSFEKNKHTLMGNSVQDVIDGMAEFHPEGIGLNCSLGPDTALPIIEEFSNLTDTPLVFKPNAGLPVYTKGGGISTAIDVEDFTDDVIKSLDYNVKYIGGCCGANATYIKRMNEKLQARKAQG